MLSAPNAAAQRCSYQANQASTDVFICFFSGFGILYGLCIDGWSAWWYLYFMIGGWQSCIKRQAKDMFGNPSDGFPIEGKFIFATIADTISEHRKNGGFVPSFWIIKTTWRRIRFFPIRRYFSVFRRKAASFSISSIKDEHPDECSPFMSFRFSMALLSPSAPESSP